MLMRGRNDLLQDGYKKKASPAGIKERVQSIMHGLRFRGFRLGG